MLTYSRSPTLTLQTHTYSSNPVLEDDQLHLIMPTRVGKHACDHNMLHLASGRLGCPLRVNFITLVKVAQIAVVEFVVDLDILLLFSDGVLIPNTYSSAFFFYTQNAHGMDDGLTSL